MISRWLISFSLLIAATGSAATLSGKIVLRDSRLADVKKHGNYSGVVISLTPAGTPTDTVSHQHFRMLQKDKTFVPHVLAIPAGSVVDFPNQDPIFHSAFSSYNGQIFDIGLYPPGETRSVHFSRPGVVRVFCNIHPTMSAVIVVLKTPYFATTSNDGSFHIDAPPGDYELHIFHERATEATLKSLTQHLSIGNGSQDLPEIVISEAGYVAGPHKNKFGKDYPPDSGRDAVYPGSRK